MVSASEAKSVSWRHQTPAIVSRHRSLACVWHYRQSGTTVSPGLLAAQKVALCNILPFGSFYSFFFNIVAKTKALIRSWKKVLPLKCWFPWGASSARTQTERTDVVSVWRFKCTCEHLQAWMSTTLFFQTALRCASLILKSQKPVVVKKKKKNQSSQDSIKWKAW